MQRAAAWEKPIVVGFHKYAGMHRDVIRQFGRFPHRNSILRRENTPVEHVYLDGDGSALVSELPNLLAPLHSDSADLVLGSRTLGNISAGAMPFHQRFGNWLSSRLLRLLYGIPVTDLGPYRAIRSELLEALAMREMTFGWPTEMMVKAAKQGARVVEVPVSWRARMSGRSKVGGTVRGSLLAAYHITAVTFRYAFGRGNGRAP